MQLGNWYTFCNHILCTVVICHTRFAKAWSCHGFLGYCFQAGEEKSGSCMWSQREQYFQPLAFAYKVQRRPQVTEKEAGSFASFVLWVRNRMVCFRFYFCKKKKFALNLFLYKKKKDFFKNQHNSEPSKIEFCISNKHETATKHINA